MDPISAVILAVVLTGLGARAAAAAAVDVIASARGQTPPTLEKWRARQARRAAQGQAPEKPVGMWRMRWRNVVEAHTAKAAQRHQARMELLRENGRQNVAKHKERLRRRAERRDRLNDLIAGWGQASWTAAKNAAKAVKPGATTPDAAVDPSPAPPDTDATDEQDATVLPFRRPDDRPDDTDTTDPAGTPAAQPDEDEHEGNTMPDSTPLTSPVSPIASVAAVEITDLPSAESACRQVVRYTDTITSSLADNSATIDAAVSGLNAEAGWLEGMKGKISGEGFGTKITSQFDTAMAAFNASTQALRAAGEQYTTAQEQVRLAGDAMRKAAAVFAEQQSLAENVSAARADAGVSKRTDFYTSA